MDWRNHGVKIVHSDELDLNTPQTSVMTRAAAITHARAGAIKLWVGTMVVQPDAKTGPHPHGEHCSLRRQGSGSNAMRRPTGIQRGSQTGRLYLRSTLRAPPGDQCQPRCSLRSCGCERRAGSDCYQFRSAHPRTRQCGPSWHAVSP
jgi:hypothetical protein